MNPLWHVAEDNQEVAVSLSRKTGLDRKLVRLLVNRGLNTEKKIACFIKPSPSQILNPFLLSGMKEAVLALKAAAARGAKIAVFSDSDLDGLTSLAVLSQALRKVCPDFIYRFPREAESYGLSMSVIDEFHEAGAELIITADSGIRDINEIAYARSLGMDVIVTDHHEPDEQLPDAVIVNPRQKNCSYPCKDLAGVGVAFKFCGAFLLSYMPSFSAVYLAVMAEGEGFSACIIENETPGEILHLKDLQQIREITDSFYKPLTVICDTAELAVILEDSLKPVPVMKLRDLFPAELRIPEKGGCLHTARFLGMDLSRSDMDIFTDLFFYLHWINSEKIKNFFSYGLSLVSIGTVADVVPLTGENRVLTACGLRELETTSHAGLSTLLGRGKVNAKKIGWDLAPLLNSPGRFGKADITADFFLKNISSGDDEIIGLIKQINSDRKKLVEDSISGRFLKKPLTSNEFLVAAEFTDVPEGVAGLIANRLMDIWSRPVLVFVWPPREGLVKGSGRAPEPLDFFSIVEPLGGFCDRLGGHSQAFGFSIAPENIQPFLDAVNSSLAGADSVPYGLEIDMELQPEEINGLFMKNILLAEPFGRGNLPPLILVRNAVSDPGSFRRIGAAKNHGKFTLDRNRLTVIGWKMADKMEQLVSSGRPLDLVFNAEEDFFCGHQTIKLILKEIELSDTF